MRGEPAGAGAFFREMVVAQQHRASARPGAADLLVRLALADGVAAHPWLPRLSGRLATTRDLSDAVHALCAIHGQHPDLIEIAAEQAEAATQWFALAVGGFAAERGALAQLTAAGGPVPSTPGQSMTAAALTAERHTLEMLARSERDGVALGAACALVADWAAVRLVLATAAERFGVTLPPCALPDEAATIAALAQAPERAVTFGAQQLFAQHRGLFSLLEARASARAA